MSKFIVTGATGTVGNAVIESLLEKNHHPIAASRNPPKSAEKFGDQVEAVFLDFEKPDSFSNLPDADGVFLLGPPLYMDLYNLLLPFVEYVEANGPKRIVYLSAYGMEHSPDLPFHGQMEEKLKSTILDWRVIRPGFFMQNFGNYERENIEQRSVIFAPAGTGKTAFVSVKDIGAVVAEMLTKAEFKHQAVELTGPEVYDYFEVAELLSGIKNKNVNYANPDSVIYREVLKDSGAPAFIADYMISVYGFIKNGLVEAPRNVTREITGRQPERLEEVLRRDFL
jgi:uncharacterized protein YbjT (DUF2867 family)